MSTIRLTLEYDGTEFSGWQRQPDARTVEGVLRAAIAAVTGEDGAITAAGRTDAGAHSQGQVVGCTLDRDWNPESLQAAINAELPADVVVRDAEPAEDTFHARKDAVDRTYRYVVVSRRHRSPMVRRFAWEVRQPLDLEAMREAAYQLVGTHDFSAFGTAPNGNGSTVRTIQSATVRTMAIQDNVSAVVVEITANAFLYGMMRSITGALVSVGRGKMTSGDVRRMLQTPPEQRANLTVAPARGLHQWKVTYR